MKRLVTSLRSAVIAFAILAAGQWVWGALLTANLKTSSSIPWSMPVMGAFLYAMWRFLSRTPERREQLRAYPVSRDRAIWTFVTGAFAIAALSGLWIVLFQLIPMTPNALPDPSKYSTVMILGAAIMGSLVSPITEEAAFRGYCQSALERVMPGAAAVVISSILFTLAHLTHGLFWPKLLVYFLFGLLMGALAYVNQSILPGIPVHCVADFVFFTMVWPYDGARDGSWFRIHVAQAAICGVLAILAFQRLTKSYNTSGGPRCAYSLPINSSSPAGTD
ncbi:MAG: CPBP family intramembrane metalloprotease [Acidobacteriia bacterium]|nr:CPBP family intramembrane metalloprotease [Terriglobia bacterium]